MTDSEPSPLSETGEGRRLRGNSIWTPQFFVVALVLLCAAAGFHFIVARFEFVFSKQELPLRMPLYQLASRFGDYVMENEAPSLTPEIEAVLGAHAYITREYHDTRKDKNEPGALIRLHIAYFTGTPDPVIHVPDVCYIAAGAQGLKKDIEVVTLQSAAFSENPDGTVAALVGDGTVVTMPTRRVAMLAFDFVGEKLSESSTVAYFFVANGNFMGTTGDVRKLVVDIRDRYAYWTKIEIFPLGVGNREEALAIVRDFLSSALPEIMLCLPDWQEVKAGRFPPGA